MLIGLVALKHVAQPMVILFFFVTISFARVLKSNQWFCLLAVNPSIGPLQMLVRKLSGFLILYMSCVFHLLLGLL